MRSVSAAPEIRIRTPARPTDRQCAHRAGAPTVRVPQVVGMMGQVMTGARDAPRVPLTIVDCGELQVCCLRLSFVRTPLKTSLHCLHTGCISQPPRRSKGVFGT